MIYLKQLKSLINHKFLVLKAGLMVGGIPLWRLLVHDWSKFMPVEFINYARFKYDIKSKREWAKAWLHHFHLNPHHSEFWLVVWRGTPNYYNDIAEPIADFVAVLPMPDTYVREMVADFLATSKEITGYWDIAQWLNANGPSMYLHDDTITTLSGVLYEIGYRMTDNCLWSYMAGCKFRKWAKEF